jgi:hypothetical protein
MSGEIQFPLTTSPGLNPMESGGRLINAYVEKAAEGSRGKWVRRRAAGLVERFVTGANIARGALLVGSVLYVVAGTKAYTITAALVVTELTGDAIGGSGLVIMDRNQNATPQVIVVHSGGQSQINTGAGTVADFSDADLPAPNSVTYVGGYFIWGIGDGRLFASGLNAVTVSAVDFTRAESAPDGVVRAVRHGSYLAAMGEKTTDFYSNTGNPTGFPFSFSSTIPYGLLTKHAVAGFELGFPDGLVFVASDRTVRRLVGFTIEKISQPDLEEMLEAVTTVTDLEMSVYVSKGRSFAVLSSATWTWEYAFPTRDSPGSWSERKSYGATRWRAHLGINAFDNWIVFDRASSSAFKVDATVKTEDGDPLVWEIRSTQAHAFPSRVEQNRASFDFETGVGRDAGVDPIETDPKVLISWSDDGARTFGNELERRLGSQGETVTVDVRRCGTTGSRGRQWRLRISDPVEIAFYGGAWEGEVVG